MENTIRQSQRTDHFLVQAAIGRDMPEFCAKRGVNLDAFARAVDLDPTTFVRFDAYISLNKFCRLMKAISVTTADDAIGLQYGLVYKPGGSGPYGLGLRAAPTFKDMLDFYARYTGVVVHFDTFYIETHRDTFSITWSYSPLIQHQEQIADFAMSALLRVFGDFAGQSVLPLRGELKRSAPNNVLLYQKNFSDKIKYGSAINRLHFPTNLLELENPAANRSAFDYMSQQCEALLDRLTRRKSVFALVTDDLAQHMGRDNCNIVEVARRLGLSERTLQRRLGEAGTDFTRLYDSTRNTVSLKLLIETERPLSEIAGVLGYGSQSAYSRAVKRQHGLTPRQIRSAGNNSRPVGAVL